MAFADVLLSIALLLLFAKILGRITERFGISALTGQILAGVLLGPVVGLVSIDLFLDNFIILGIILLLFLAGLEVKFEDVKNNIYPAAGLAIGAGVLSFVLGLMVGLALYQDAVIGFAIGTVLASTSNGSLFALLMKTRHFNSPIGKLIVSTSIADDVLGILALSVFSFFAAHALPDFGKLSSLFFIVVGLYLVVMTMGERIMRFLLPLFNSFRDEQIMLAVPLALALLLSFFTEQIELSLAAGAFLAGMTMANSPLTTSLIERKINVLGEGFLIPLFYAGIGTLLVLTDIQPMLVLAIIAAAVIGKVVGAAVVAHALRLRPDEIKLISISLIPRGNENIALAQLVFALGLISLGVYTSIILALVATVVLTPILMKIFYT